VHARTHRRGRAVSSLVAAAASLGAVLIAACGGPEPDLAADAIYTGGDIVTLIDAQPAAEAVATKDGKILAVGARAEIESAHADDATRVIDLAGQTFLPGFIDSNGDYFATVLAGDVDAGTPPVGPDKGVTKPTRELVIGRTRAVQLRYAQAGITTAYAGGTHADELEMLQHASASGAHVIDVVVFPSIRDLDRVLATNPVGRWGKYINRLKIGGVQIMAGAGALEPMVQRVHDLGVPVDVDANGDDAMTKRTDSPDAPLDPMLLLWSAVNRVSRDRATIDADQRVTPLEGLQAMTINAAQRFGEEASKGTIEPGKLADLVILDRNPLQVDPMQIKDIQVVETIKEGVTIYARAQSTTR
jgi:predicted amidohydrolase YtcJ